MRFLSRRDFLASSLSAGAVVLSAGAGGAEGAGPEPIIDIHQHTSYRGRTDPRLIAHQQAMGTRRNKP
jgi:hypothetical protein